MPTPPSPWAALLPAALAGTRRISAPASLPGLTPSLGAEADAPEKQLLLTAANLALVQRAGQRPQPGLADGLGQAPLETRPALGPATLELVRRVLTQEPLWGVRDCCLDSLVGYRLPARELAWLLRHRPDESRRFLPQSLTGERGPWLPGYYRRPVLDGWWLVSARERDDNLQHLRRRRPPGGWQWLRDALRGSTPPQRQALLPVLEQWAETEPVPADFTAAVDAALAAEPALLYPPEALARVPGTTVLAHHWAQARRLLSYEPGDGQLTVALPDLTDPNWAADERQLPTRDAKRAPEWLLAQYLRWVQPSRWATSWGVAPARAVALASATSRQGLLGSAAGLLLDSWLEAAVRFRDVEFARALLAHPRWTQPRPYGSIAFWELALDACALLPGDEQAAWRLRWLPTLPHQPLPVQSSGQLVFPNWLDWVDHHLYEPPTELLLRMVAFMRDYFALPPSPIFSGGHHSVENALANLLKQTYFRQGDLRQVDAVEAELLPLAHAQPTRPLGEAVLEVWPLLALRREFAASLASTHV